jgi:putative oxidoreductase
MKQYFDNLLITLLKGRSIAILRLSLAIIFLWFGVLKILGVSPVAYIIERTHDFMPIPMPIFIIMVGLLEVIIGLGLFFKYRLRLTLTLLWLQMLGVMTSVLFEPSLFFDGWNILLPTVEGEFVAKNIVLIAGSLVVASHEVLGGSTSKSA